MEVANLSPEILAKIKVIKWDRIIEKHEGPESWASVLEYYDPEFLEIEGRWILLPIGREQHQNISILRTIWSEDGNSLTLFLKDTTYDDDPFCSGYLAVCDHIFDVALRDRLQDEQFYVAIVYHEWFIIEQV
jgi:hypothetical protein